MPKRVLETCSALLADLLKATLLLAARKGIKNSARAALLHQRAILQYPLFRALSAVGHVCLCARAPARVALDANELCEFPIKPAQFIVRRILSHASAEDKTSAGFERLRPSPASSTSAHTHTQAGRQSLSSVCN